MPYFWAASISGDITVGNLSAELDLDFDDLIDAVDVGAGILSVARYQRWVGAVQFDYIDLDTDNLDDAPAGGSLETTLQLLTAALGYQFGEPASWVLVDVLVGVRYLSLDSTLQLNGIGSAERDRELIDPTLLVNPSFALTEKFRFNPAFAVGGGGDSDFVYELQPNVQYAFNDSLDARLGYRTLQYDVEDGNFEFDGGFQGLTFGIGFQF